MQQEPQFLPTGVPRGVGGGLSGQVGACWFPLGAQGLGGAISGDALYGGSG